MQIFNLRYIIPQKSISKLLLVMRLSTFLIMIFLLQAGATTVYSQKAKVTIDAQHAKLSDILEQVERQTNYLFFYNKKNINTNKEVDLKIVDTPVSEVLDKTLGNDISYMMVNDHIILSKKEDKGISQLLAQQGISITGTVTDEAGDPMPGVNIIVKGTFTGVVTDIDGKYTINAPSEQSILVFSFVGYLTEEIPVSGQRNITVKLVEDTQQLEEVVVVGYGTMKKRDLTGSVSNIRSDKLLDRPAVNAGQALQGRFAGVDIIQNSGVPGGELRIRVRGDNSISSSSDPLWVVDGIVGAWNASSINPNDIETIEVLKDASATAIYGARGANGVIMVTTKRGLTGKPVINYDGYVSVSNLSKKIDLLNAADFMKIYNMSFDNAAKYDPTGYAQGKYKRNTPENFPALFNADGTPKYDTDWQDEVYRTAVGQNHQFSIRGGTEKVKYGAFAGITLQPGIMDRSNFDRYTGRITIDGDLYKWLSISSFLSVNYNTRNLTRDDLDISRRTMEAIPIVPVQFDGGRYSTQSDFLGWEQENPVKRIYQIEDVKNTYQTMASFAADIKFTPDLILRSSFSIDLGSIKSNYYSGRDLNLISATQKGNAEISSSMQRYWQNENYLTYDKYFNQVHHLTAMAGLSWQRRYSEDATAKAQNFMDDFYQWHNLGVGTVMQPSASSDRQWSINSYFARVNYVFADKYLFTATGRIDGSSKFGRNNKYAFFPSAAIAWRLSQEDFLRDNKVVSNLKVRASVGQTGNQEIDPYQSLQMLGTGQIILSDNYQTAMYKSTFGNSDLRWEKTTQYDAGIDLGMFKQRINFTADYYYKITEDMLLATPLPYSSGMETVMTNIGSLKNTGVELTLNTINIRSSNFEWTTGLNWSINRNEVTKLGTNNEDIFPGPQHQLSLGILRVGEPIGLFWGYTREGIWSEAEAAEAAKYNRKPGDVKFADLDGSTSINEKDESIIGCAAPDWVANLSNTIRWKNIDFTFDLRWVYGSQIYNTTKMTTVDRSTIANNQAEVLNAWTPSNQNTMVAERRPTSIYYDNKPDSYKVENGSYLRGQNFVLGYTLPANLTTKWYIQRLRIYASAQNLFCITDYSGYDPEIKTYGTNVFAQNMDFYGYPKPRTFTFGLNVTF